MSIREAFHLVMSGVQKSIFARLRARLRSSEQPVIGTMFKTALIVEFIFEACIMVACAAVWAAAGFPRLTEVAGLGGLGFICFGVYLGIILTRD
jgi:hypothetical protein